MQEAGGQRRAPAACVLHLASCIFIGEIRVRSKFTAYSVYLFSEFTLALLFSMMFTVDGVYQVSLVGLNALQLVLVGTTLEVSAFLFEVPTGVVADVFSRRLSIIVGMFVMGLGFIVEGSFPFFAPILLAQVLWGLGYTFTSGATEAWIADEVGEEQAGRAFLRASQVGTLGALIGIVPGMLIGLLGINIPIVLGGLLLMALGAALIVIMPERGFKPTPRENRNTFQSMAHTFKSGLRVVRGKPALINILTIGLILGLYSEGFDRLWTPHLLNDITLAAIGDLQPVVWFGIIRGIGMLLGIGITEFVRRRIDTSRHGPVARAVLILISGMVAGLLAFALTGSFVIALIAFWGFSSLRRTLGPLYTAWVNQHAESSVRATVISMSSQIDALGQILGGPVIGAVGLALGIPVSLTICAVVLATALPLLIRTIQIDREEDVVATETLVPD
jgi:DHA3 family tetracycline resistance protein-like MFS transporter